MTECAECGALLDGQHVIAADDGPFEPGDPVPTGGPLYDERCGTIECPGCGSRRPVTPRQYHEGARKL